MRASGIRELIDLGDYLFFVRVATIGGTGGSGKRRRFTHLGRLARRLLLRFLPLEGRHDLNLSQGPLLPFLGASLVEDTVAELDAVLLEEEKDGRGKYFRQLEGSKVRSKGGVIGATRPVRRGASAFIRAYRARV